MILAFGVSVSCTIFRDFSNIFLKICWLYNYLLVWTRTDNTTLQGSMTLMEGSDIHFVTAKNVSKNSPRQHRFSVKLLKVELDYRIIDKYRFFVPKLQENTLCQCQCSKDTNGVQGLTQSAL